MRRLLISGLLALLPAAAPAETVLLMAEKSGCYWCAKWHQELGGIYPKTPEGRTAPLLRYELNAASPDAELARTVQYTPTFILVDDGQEVGRIEGYPGEDFFWGMLTSLFLRAEISLDHAS